MKLKYINHPDEYKSGIRVITVVRRRKDKLLHEPVTYSEEQKNVFKLLNYNPALEAVNAKSNETLYITDGIEDFNNRMGKILSYMDYDQRVYVTASERSFRKSVHKFKQMMLDNELRRERDSSDSQLRFFQKINSRVCSAFGKPSTEVEKRWLFDCDSEEDRELVSEELKTTYPNENPEPYWYKTKSGHHCVVKPFNRSLLVEEANNLIHENAQMIWAYYSE